MAENDEEATLKLAHDGTRTTPPHRGRPNYNFKPFSLNQQLLIAPDLNDWLPDGHLARAIAATIEVMEEAGDLDPFYAAYRENGQGAWSYNPKMMVCIVMYGWCVGVVTTRKIARAIETDVAFRYLSGNQFPDFRTIGYFIRMHEDAIEALFDVVLRMCMEAGMTKVGRVALDGRIVQANASIDRNRTADHITGQVRSIVEEMRRLEAAEDELFGDRRGDELPEDLQDPAQRKQLLDEARRRLDAKSVRSKDQNDLEHNEAPRSAPDRLYSKLKALLRSHDLLYGREQEWEDGIRSEQQEKIDRWERKQGNRRGKRPMSPDEKVDRERENRFKRRKQAPTPNPDLEPAESDAEWEERVRREQQEKIDRRKEEEERSGKPSMGRPPLSPDEKVKCEGKKRRRKQRNIRRRPEKDEEWFDRNNAKINLTDPDSRSMKGRRGWKQAYNDQTMVDPDSQIILATDTVSEGNDKLQLIPMLGRCEGSSGKFPDDTIVDSGYYSENAAAVANEHTELWSTTQKDWKTRKKLREQGCPRGRIPNDATPTERMERKLLTQKGREMYKKRYAVEAVQGQLSNRGFKRFLRRGLKKARMESSLWKSTGNILKMYKAGKLPGTGTT